MIAKGARTSCLRSIVGKWASKPLLFTEMMPVPGLSQTLATLVFRLPATTRNFVNDRAWAERYSQVSGTSIILGKRPMIKAPRSLTCSLCGKPRMCSACITLATLKAAEDMSGIDCTCSNEASSPSRLWQGSTVRLAFPLAQHHLLVTRPLNWQCHNHAGIMVPCDPLSRCSQAADDILANEHTAPFLHSLHASNAHARPQGRLDCMTELPDRIWRLHLYLPRCKEPRLDTMSAKCLLI